MEKSKAKVNPHEVEAAGLPPFQAPDNCRKTWEMTDEVLTQWVRAMPRHPSLAVPVAILLGSRLIAVTLDVALDFLADSREG